MLFYKGACGRKSKIGAGESVEVQLKRESSFGV